VLHPDDERFPAVGAPSAAVSADSVIWLLHINAFTSEAFGGNPAAVCLLEAEADAAWMQGVARNMNLSETAFLRPMGES